MKKVHKTIVTFIAISLIVIGALYITFLLKPDNKMIFYYGVTCPHCKNVEKWMDENDALAKLNIVEKEVFENPLNAAELQTVAAKCGIKREEMGVPLVYFKGKCYVGDVDSINLMNNTINNKK